MPKIPRSQRTIGRNRVNTGRVINTVSEEQFGFGRTKQEAVRATQQRDNSLVRAAQLGNMFKQELDRTEGMRAANGFDAERERIEAKYKQERGRNAIEKFSEYKTKLDDLKSKYSEKLSNENQTAVYNDYANRSERNFLETARSHSMAESRVYNKEVRTERRKRNVNDAVSGYSIPNRVSEKISLLDQELESEYNLEGHSQEWLANKKKEVRSEIHGAIIGKLVGEQEAGKAKAWLEANKNGLDEESYLEARKLVDSAYMIEEHQGITEGMISNGLSEREALAQARKNSKGKKEENLVSMIKRRYSEMERAGKANKNEVLMDFVAEIKSGKHYDTLLSDPAFEAMGKENQKLLLRVYEKFQEGGDTPTNLAVKGQVREMLLNPETRDKAVRDNVLEKNMDLFSTEDYLELKRFETFVARNDLGKINDYQGKNQRFQAKLNKSGIALSDKESKALKEKYYIELDRFQEETGKSATKEDEKEIFNTLTTEVIVDKDNAEWFQFGDDKKRVFELEPSDFEIGDLEGSLESIVEADLVRKGVLSELSPISERDEAIQKALAENYTYYSERMKNMGNEGNSETLIGGFGDS